MKNMLHTILLLLASLVAFSLQAQEMSVKSFELRPTDITAKVKPVYDLNGDACALIRVEVALSNVRFEGMVIGNPIEKTGEYFVYVPVMAKSIRIKAQGNLPLEYTFPIQLEKMRSYGMRILLPGVPDAGELPRPTAQYVVMKVTPPQAVVVIDDMMRPLDKEGNLFLELALGEHTYQVSAAGYQTKSGTFPLIDSEKTTLDIVLKPATGWIELSSQPAEGVQVLIDGKSWGETPCRVELPEGAYKLQLLKPGYLAYNRDLSIRAGETIRLQADLKINSSQVTLVAANEQAEIWVSGQRMGVGRWSGPLDAGTYSVSSRCEGYEEMVDIITVAANDTRNFTLSEQVPIFGVLKVVSQPMGADIYLDGTKIGQTPYQNSRVLTGRHTLWLVKEEYRTENREIVLKRGEPANLTIEMSAGISTIPSKPSASKPAAKPPVRKQESGSKTASTGSYKVGDYYDKEGMRGVIFWVDASGEHGKILAETEQKCVWDTAGMERQIQATDLADGSANQSQGVALQVPSFLCCQSLGNGWYLPAKEELQQIFKAKIRINETLRKHGLPILSSAHTYWSSSESDVDQAWCVEMLSGKTYNKFKTLENVVRAVAKF